MSDFEERMRTTKNISFDKKYVLIEEETFDSMNDVKDISKGTAKEDVLFDYAKVPSYLKSSKKCNKEKNKDDFELSL